MNSFCMSLETASVLMCQMVLLNASSCLFWYLMMSLTKQSSLALAMTNGPQSFEPG